MFSIKTRLAALERGNWRNSPVLLWLNEDESETEARERAGLHPDDPVMVFRWMTADEASPKRESA